jgi:hypothetical protein
MAELAEALERMAGAYIDHPVVDATGLEGQASDPNGITVFEAMERELGLRLVRQKQKIPVIVVDHVDEKPIE